MELMDGDLTRQLARVSPTGPHPAISTCEVILCMVHTIIIIAMLRAIVITIQQTTMITERKKRVHPIQQINYLISNSKSNMTAKPRMKVGLLECVSDEQKEILNSEQIIRIMNMRFRSLSERQRIPGIVYRMLRTVNKIEKGDDLLERGSQEMSLSEKLSPMLMTENCFYHENDNNYDHDDGDGDSCVCILVAVENQKMAKFRFYKNVNKCLTMKGMFALSQLPTKISSCQIFEGEGGEPIAIITTSNIALGLIATLNPLKQRQIFQYSFQCQIKSSVLIKNRLFFLLKTQKMITGKYDSSEMTTPKYLKDKKIKEMKRYGNNVVLLTKNYLIYVISREGKSLKMIRTGIEITSIHPIHLSHPHKQYSFLVEKEGKQLWLITSPKNHQSSHSKIDKISCFVQGVEKVFSLGNYVLLQTRQEKLLYLISLGKEKKVGYQIYCGGLLLYPGMINALYHCIRQGFDL